MLIFQHSSTSTPSNWLLDHDSTLNCNSAVHSKANLVKKLIFLSKDELRYKVYEQLFQCSGCLTVSCMSTCSDFRVFVEIFFLCFPLISPWMDCWLIFWRTALAWTWCGVLLWCTVFAAENSGRFKFRNFRHVRPESRDTSSYDARCWTYLFQIGTDDPNAIN